MDTGVFKSALRFSVFGKHTKIFDDDGNQTGGYVPIIEKNFNDEANISEEDRKERNLVEKIAELAKQGKIEAVTSNEVMFMEFSKLPKTFPASSGPFHGASYKIVPCPVRTWYTTSTTKEDLRGYIEGISDRRFMEIRKQVGAYQGRRIAPINQLFDALFIWTAERNDCSYFLTIDKKLAKYDLRSKTMVCVRPSELMNKLT